MRISKPFLFVLLIAVIAQAPLFAAPKYGVSSQEPRIPAKHLVPVKKAIARKGLVQLSGLKAVLIGAPIDGPTGSWTLSEIKNLKSAADVLRANGVDVREFYSPASDWAQIKKAAEGAQFLLYRGHGVYDGSTPPVWVGGFSIDSGFVSPDTIKTELKLSPGAIVMLYGCFTAGNAGFDIGAIDATEAQRRIVMYAKPFVEINTSGYFADWYGEAFPSYLGSLFDGKTLLEAWKSFDDYSAATAVAKKYPGSPSYAFCYDYDNWDGKIAYNNAFVGLSDSTLSSLFSGGAVNTVGNTGTTAESGSVESADAGATREYLYQGGTFTCTAPGKWNRTWANGGSAEFSEVDKNQPGLIYLKGYVKELKNKSWIVLPETGGTAYYWAGKAKWKVLAKVSPKQSGKKSVNKGLEINVAPTGSPE